MAKVASAPDSHAPGDLPPAVAKASGCPLSWSAGADDTTCNLSFLEQKGARPALLVAGAYSLLVYTLLAHDAAAGTFWCPLSQCEAARVVPSMPSSAPVDLEFQRLAFSMLCLLLDVFVLYVHWTRPVHPKFVLCAHRRWTMRLHLLSGSLQCLCGLMVCGLLFDGREREAGHVASAVAALGYLVHVPTSMLLLTSAFGAVRIMLPGFLHATFAYMYALSRLLLCPPEMLAHEFTAYWLGFHVYAFNRVVFVVLTKFNVMADARYTLSILLGLAIALPAAHGWAAVPLLVGAVVAFNVAFTLFMDKKAQATTERYSAGASVNTALLKRHFVAPEGLVAAPELRDRGQQLSREERARLVYEHLDCDASGRIELRELGRLLVSWGLPRYEAEGALREVDTDGSGAITFEEFLHRMQPVWEFAVRVVLSNAKEA